MSYLRSIFLVAASLLMLAGIFGPKLMRFDARETQGQKVFFIGGTPVVLADGGAVRVMMGSADPAPEKDQRINFYLRVENRTDEPITISADQIGAVRSDGQEIRIWPATEVRRDIAKRADRKRFAAALAAALSGFGAGYQGGPNQDARIAEHNRLMQEQIQRADTDEALDRAMSGLFLERETLFPGQYFFGFVQIDPPDRKGRTTDFKFLTIFADDPMPLQFRYEPAE